MGMYASKRNFGFGRSMSYAGLNALRDLYAGGHFATVAAHASRWEKFCNWARENGIKDASAVDVSVIERFAQTLQDHAVSYRHNTLSSINTVMYALRGDRAVSVSPKKLAGAGRTRYRQTAPTGMDRAQVDKAAGALRTAGLQRAASVVELARDLGVREKEAALADLKRLAREAKTLGRVNVQEGTKGGRNAPRWVPVSDKARQSIDTALSIAKASGSRNLLCSERWIDFKKSEIERSRAMLKEHGIDKIHDLRAAYACERYQTLTGHVAPILGGDRVDREADERARSVIAHELGHGRPEIAAAYIGRKGR
jgi:uncharacterized lipoprotein NlpE involved in copper resistance